MTFCILFWFLKCWLNWEAQISTLSWGVYQLVHDLSASTYFKNRIQENGRITDLSQCINTRHCVSRANFCSHVTILFHFIPGLLPVMHCTNREDNPPTLHLGCWELIFVFFVLTFPYKDAACISINICYKHNEVVFCMQIFLWWRT